MSLAKRIAAKRAEQERGFLDVEEWGEGDQPLRLYFTTVSARDMEQVQRKHKDFINNPTMYSFMGVRVWGYPIDGLSVLLLFFLPIRNSSSDPRPL